MKGCSCCVLLAADIMNITAYGARRSRIPRALVGTFGNCGAPVTLTNPFVEVHLQTHFFLLGLNLIDLFVEVRQLIVVGLLLHAVELAAIC